MHRVCANAHAFLEALLRHGASIQKGQWKERIRRVRKNKSKLVLQRWTLRYSAGAMELAHSCSLSISLLCELSASLACSHALALPCGVHLPGHVPPKILTKALSAVSVYDARGLCQGPPERGGKCRARRLSWAARVHQTPATARPASVRLVSTRRERRCTARVRFGPARECLVCRCAARACVVDALRAPASSRRATCRT